MTSNPLDTLRVKIQSDANLLALNPSNVALRTTILRDQVASTSIQLQIPNDKAGDVVRSYTAAYAYSKGADPKAILDALSADEQKILNYSMNNPKIFGVDISIATKIAGYAAAASGVLFVAGLATAIFAIITIGPEAAGAALVGEGLLATLGNAFKIPAMRNAIILFALSGTLEAFSLVVPMITKQMIDNGSIGPGLRISALKEAEDLKSKLSGTATPGSFTGSQFTDYASSLEVSGIKGINDPCKAQSVIYSRKALAELVSCVYGKAASSGKGTTVTKLIPQLAEYLIMEGKVAVSHGLPAEVPIASSGAPTSTKVFTGVISQGVVGSAPSFTPRPDDLITSMDDLQQAINNNVASYLASLPSRVVYEIKVVSSVVVNGVKKIGQSTQVPSGSNKDGTTKYKSVLNKFAVADLYILTDKGTRSKLTSIILGPTDAINFQPNQSALLSIAQSVSKNVVTSNTDNISAVASNTPTASLPAIPTLVVYTVAPAPDRKFPLPPGATTPEFSMQPNGHGGLVNAEKTDMQDLLGAGNDVYAVYTIVRDALGTRDEATINSAILNWARNVTPYEADQMKVFYRGGVATVSPPAPPPQQETAEPTPAPANPSLPAGAQIATTLSNFYGALGMQLPNLDTRGRLYESLGLGQTSFYTGTAEQNAKLLGALKIKGI